MDLLPALGVPPDRLTEALATYLTFYFREGLHQAIVYDGVVEALTSLGGRYPRS